MTPATPQTQFLPPPRTPPGGGVTPQPRRPPLKGVGCGGGLRGCHPLRPGSEEAPRIHHASPQTYFLLDPSPLPRYPTRARACPMPKPIFSPSKGASLPPLPCPVTLSTVTPSGETVTLPCYRFWGHRGYHHARLPGAVRVGWNAPSPPRVPPPSPQPLPSRPEGGGGDPGGS